MSEGFGICGHKNNFNSGVRCGNWVEDQIGNQIANDRAVNGEISSTGRTTTSDAFIQPRNMVDTASRGCPYFDPTATEESRKGVKGHLLFAHGKPEEAKNTPADTYNSVNTLLFNNQSDSRSDAVLTVKKPTYNSAKVTYNSNSNSIARKKANELAREQRSLDKRFTQNRGASAKLQAVGKLALLGSTVARNGTFTAEYQSGAYVNRD